jgi:hypothetical protein
MIFFTVMYPVAALTKTFDSDYYLTSISHQDGGLPKVRVSPTSALRQKRPFHNRSLRENANRHGMRRRNSIRQSIPTWNDFWQNA